MGGLYCSFSELNVDMAENGTVSGIGKRE